MKLFKALKGSSATFLFFFTTFFTFSLQANNGLIIQYKDTRDSSLRQNLTTLLPIQKSHFLTDGKTQVIELDSSAPIQEIIRNIRQNDQVEYVEEDSVISAHNAPDDSLFPEQWSLEGSSTNVNVEKAWDYITDSSSITIALIDSGCNYDHEDIRDNIWKNTAEIPNNRIDDDHDGYIDDYNGYDFQNSDSYPLDDYEHGSLVFGIVAAKGNNKVGISGINWNAQIMCLKVLDSTGNSTISKAVEAIAFAISHHVKIINMSWGYSPNETPSRTLEDAIRRAKTAGVLIVTSAGNGSPEGQGQNNDSDSHTANYPSSYPEDNIIAVAATDSTDHLAGFSNFGINTVDLGAPGVSVLSTHPNRRYDYFTGTSAAAPHVTGAAALIWALNPSLQYTDIKRLILETSDPQSSLTGKTLTGGRLNIGRAIEASPAGGGSLLASPSTLPTSNQGFDSYDTGDSEVSAQSGGCSLNRNERQTSPRYLFAGILIVWIYWRLKKEKSRN